MHIDMADQREGCVSGTEDLWIEIDRNAFRTYGETACYSLFTMPFETRELVSSTLANCVADSRVDVHKIPDDHSA